MLRAATAAEHERVDSLFSRFDLASRAGYRDFLTAQAAAFLPVEDALEEAGAAQLVPDWPARRRGHFLVMDLAALKAVVPCPVGTVDLAGPDQILGALYVLEGSRLGGSVLKRMVAPTLPQTFLAAKGPPGSWRALLELLDRRLPTAAAGDAAITSARQVFALFESAAALNPGARAA